MMQKDLNTKQVVSWAFYDWANSAFATTVMAGFFPIFFKEYWSAGTDNVVSTFHLGAANSLASVIVAGLAPVLGAIADRGSARKRFLLLFALMGIVMTGSLYFVARGHWELAVAVYVLATVGFSGSNIFYDALMVGIAGEDKIDWVSALGFSLGYLGGGLLFALNVAMTLKPHAFGLAGSGEAIRLSFVSVALWWFLFSIPLLLWVKEPRQSRNQPWSTVIRSGFQQLRGTFYKVRSLRMVFLFLVSYWLYIDGVDTIVRMAVDYGLSLGFSSKSLILALLITQFIGFPSALLFGKIGRQFGPKAGIYLGVGVYVMVTFGGFFMKREAEFYILAAIIGLVQGGVQSLSRSFYTRLIPKGQAAEFFGFYNMLGKCAAVIGPFLMGWVGMVSGNPRYAILSVGLLFLFGAAALIPVDEEEGRRLARQLEADE